MRRRDELLGHGHPCASGQGSAPGLPEARGDRIGGHAGWGSKLRALRAGVVGEYAAWSGVWWFQTQESRLTFVGGLFGKTGCGSRI